MMSTEIKTALRVLIVDDEESYRQHISRHLKAEGCEVLATAHAEEALRIGITFHPHVLLIDWMLRDYMDGIQVAKGLLSVWPALKVIVMTGYPAEHFDAATTGFTPFGFLEKPFGLKEVRDAIEKARNH